MTRGEVGSVWARHAAPEIGQPFLYNVRDRLPDLHPRAERHTLGGRLGQADSLQARADSIRAAPGN